MSIASEPSHMALHSERYVVFRESYKHRAPTEHFLSQFTLTSLVPQSGQGIDLGRAPRWDVTRNERHQQ
jgi:hypothetical protein